MTERSLTSTTALMVLAAAALLCLPGVAPAQDGHRAAKAEQKFAERFKAADKDGNGQLSKAEAEAGMPRLAKRFDEIDSAKSGQISQEQAKAWMAQQRQQHRNAKTPPAAS